MEVIDKLDGFVDDSDPDVSMEVFAQLQFIYNVSSLVVSKVRSLLAMTAQVPAPMF